MDSASELACYRVVVLSEPLVRHTGPTTMQVPVNEQAAEHRWVVHLLHYIPDHNHS